MSPTYLHRKATSVFSLGLLAFTLTSCTSATDGISASNSDLLVVVSLAAAVLLGIPTLAAWLGRRSGWTVQDFLKAVYGGVALVAIVGLLVLAFYIAVFRDDPDGDPTPTPPIATDTPIVTATTTNTATLTSAPPTATWTAVPPTATSTATPTPVPVPPTPTSTPVPFTQALSVPGNSEAGLSFEAPAPGTYSIAYQGDAYSPWPNENWERYLGWTTFVRIYVDKPIMWGTTQESDAPGIGTIEWDEFIGSDYNVSRDAVINATQGQVLEIPLDEGQVLNMVAIDHQGSYWDNRGKVDLLITLLNDGSSSVNNHGAPTVLGYETIEGAGTRHISLSDGEVIVGTADRFGDDVDAADQPKCTAFLMRGPIELDVRIWWGGWEHWANVYDDENADALLARKVSELENHQTCPGRGIQEVRLP